MGDESQPKRRRKRVGMFYKVKYLQQGEEIPRQTLRRQSVSALNTSTDTPPHQNPRVILSADLHQKDVEPGSHPVIPSDTSLPPVPLVVNPEISSETSPQEKMCSSHHALHREEHTALFSSTYDQISHSVEDPQVFSEQGAQSTAINERSPSFQSSTPDERSLASASMSGGEVRNVTDAVYDGATERVDGGGGGGPSGSSSSSDDSDTSSDESSIDQTSSDKSSCDPSSDGGTSSEEELRSDACFTEARDRADKLNRKYSLDDKIKQSNDNQLSKIECLLLVLSFSMRHALDDVAVGDLLKLVNHIMGQEVIPHSLWVFNKIFNFNCGIDYHFYCLKCEIYIGKYSDLSDKICVDCPNRFCSEKCNVSKMNDGHFFLTLPLRPQLQCFLENTPGINDLLNYRFSREISEGTISDIFDGELYRKLSQEGEMLSDPNNFSLSFITDGVPIFLSVNNSMWPIQCRINELPPQMRFSSQNMFISGIWFGSKSHPNMNVYLTQFCQEARSLYLEGLQWKQPSGEVALSKLATLQCILDSVAKPDVQCMKLFNGYCACGYCYHPGILVNLEN